MIQISIYLNVDQKFWNKKDTVLPRFSSSLSELLATLSCICGFVYKCSFLSCLFSSDKMRFMLNLALKLELHRGGEVESPLVARLEDHLRQGRLHQRIGWWLARKLVTFWQRWLMNKDMLYTNHICHLKASRKLRRPESPGYGERERAKSAELSSGFRLEFGLES